LQYYSQNDEQQLKLLKRSSDESSSTEAPTTSTRSPAQGQKEVPMLRPPNPAKGHAEVKPTAHPSSVYDAIKRLLTIEDLQVCVFATFSLPSSNAFFALSAFYARVKFASSTREWNFPAAGKIVSLRRLSPYVNHPECQLQYALRK
jgi:hypothetical protein